VGFDSLEAIARERAALGANLFDEIAADRQAYRAHFESRRSGGRFEDELPGYEFGRSLRGTGSRWEDIEPTARSRWEASRPGTWERFKESIRYAFSRPRSGER
jgi:hypothetical protein